MIERESTLLLSKGLGHGSCLGTSGGLKEVIILAMNCGDTRPVFRFRISATEEACLGDGPKLMPILVLSIHFLAFFPSWMSLLRT